MGIDKDKVRKSAQDAKEKALQAKTQATAKAKEARKRVEDYAKQGMAQRIICIVAFGAILLTLCYAFYSAAISDEYMAGHFGCQPTATQDCKKYFDVLNLWRPYRMTPYSIPDE